MSLNALAPEIILDISNYVEHSDLRRLCMVSRRLMSTLQEILYKVIELDETSLSADAFFAVVSGPRGRIVRHIRYKPRDPWPRQDIRHRPKVRLSNETCRALESLDLFPSLERFQFDLRDWNLSDWKDAPFSFSRWGFHKHHGPWHFEPWRVLIEGSLEALTKSAGSFSQLELNDLPPTRREMYHTCEYLSDAWGSLLRGLESFEISLAGVEDRGNGTITTAHQAFISLFPDMFLKYLNSVKFLRLTGTRDAIIGSEGFVEPIDWASLSLPLTSFELEYSHTSDDLIKFLFNHADKLEKICLRNCIAPKKQTWSNLIQVFLDKQPTQLVEFTIVSYPVRLRHGNPDYWQRAVMGSYDMLGEATTDKMRRFVVGVASDRHRCIKPVEDSVEDGDPELDESDVCNARRSIFLEMM
ncbi:hypothetical protein F53441_11145 [Fusarium austroafricanum]|uniref:F-box domain-containing protein n=1 Tax=Fusarium austroafricanum TaxID=2364996 RepID=A0A8H4K465_9HYPO|nr:hypothetical protein F53441_11145 [Fusarium austroafricanum]